MQTRASTSQQGATNSSSPFTPHPEQETGKSHASNRNGLRQWAWGFAIALLFAAWGMRTEGRYNVVETDAARHAMNGVFLRDLVLQGRFTHVSEYARNYYAHLPALSLPYHPPMFPMIEVVFYSLFGLNIFAARLAIALAVAISALAMFGLVLKTHRSVAIASLSTITFLCLPESLWLSSDVMLEFPTLAFTLLAFYCLQSADRTYPISRALCFALLGGAAVWTKQLAVFLIAVPFLYLAFLGRWRLFLKPAIWISTAAFGAIVAVLVSLSLSVHGAGVDQAIPAAPIPMYLAYYRLIVRNALYYGEHYYQVVGPVGMILLAALVTALSWMLFQRATGKVVENDPTRLRRSFWEESALYLAWLLASLGVLFMLRPYATRYLFFTYPTLIVLGYGSLFHLARLLPGGRQIGLAAASALTVLAVFQFPHRIKFLHGPEEAAALLANTGATRILYCGGTDGNFILNYRLAHPGLDTTIIACDKLPNAMFTPANFEKFANEYGVQYVVIEDAAGWHGRWTGLASHLPTMVLERQFDLASSTDRWVGNLRVYRFTNPSPHPRGDLAMRMFMIGGTMDFDLAPKGR
jgi:hypothetical protein